MYTSIGVNKNIISTKLIKTTISGIIVMLLLNLILLYLVSEGISYFLLKSKTEEFRTITFTITNELLESDYKSVRNKLALFSKTNNFKYYSISNVYGDVVAGNYVVRSDNMYFVDVKVVYPNSSEINSIIRYYFEDSYFKNTKYLFIGYSSIVIMIIIAVLAFYTYQIVNYFTDCINDYDRTFESIFLEPDIKIHDIINNPFYPTLVKFKESLLKIKDDSEKLLLYEKRSYRLTLAKQVAHDIRSPLSVLNMLIPSLSIGGEEEKVNLINQAVHRINNIADDLLDKGESSRDIALSDEFSKNNKDHKVYLVKLVNQIISEKKSSAEKSIFIKLNTVLSEDNLCTIKISASDLSRIMSNLINNSIEATTGVEGVIVIEIGYQADSLKISISDNGKGIPKDMLARVGLRGFTIGKENSSHSGSGLGLYHAKTTIENAGGKFEISSELGVGTVVSITV